MQQQQTQGLVINPVRERFLFFSPTVQGRLEREACSNDFEVINLFPNNQVIQGLGQGAFGKVYKVRHKKTKNVYALKQVSKKQIKQQKMVQQIINEVKIMYNIDHPNIIKLFNHYEEEEYLYLILECASGGQLWQRLNQAGRFDEGTVKQYMREIISAIEYLHTKKPPIIHRDIKPENILLDKDGKIKLADFGWSNFSNNNTKRQTYCGTLDYLAPEMIMESGHDEKLDYWSLGVLIVELLTGKAPFTPPENVKDPREQQKILEDNILKVKINFPSDFPTLAKSLVQGLLVKDPAKRFTILSMKEHPWLTIGQVQPISKQQTNLPKQIDVKDVIKDDKGQFSKEEIAQIASRDAQEDKSKQEEEEQIIIIEENDKQGADPTKNTMQILNQKIIDLNKQLNETKVMLQVKVEECAKLQQQLNEKGAGGVASTTDTRRMRLLEEEKEKLKKDFEKLWNEQRVKETQIVKLQNENLKIQELQRQVEKYKSDKQQLQEKIRKLNDELGSKDQQMMELRLENEQNLPSQRMNKTQSNQNSFLGGLNNPNNVDESFGNISILDLSTSFNEMKQRFQIAKEQIEEFDKAQRKIVQLEADILSLRCQLDTRQDEIKQDIQFQFEEDNDAILQRHQEEVQRLERKLQETQMAFEREKDNMKKDLSRVESLKIEAQSLKKQLQLSDQSVQDMKQEWEQNKKLRGQFEQRIREMEVTILDLRENEKQMKRRLG